MDGLQILYLAIIDYLCRHLNNTYLDKLGIHFMAGWKDPWGER